MKIVLFDRGFELAPLLVSNGAETTNHDVRLPGSRLLARQPIPNLGIALFHQEVSESTDSVGSIFPGRK
jgi:hypothetical protein